MLSLLKKVARQVLPRTMVAQYRHRHHVDEVSMIAAICERDAEAVMVDVGAHFGGCTREFLQLGWRVIAYEPDPNNRAKFLAEHGENPRVTWSADAISEQEGQEVALYASDVSSGISGLSAFHASHQPIATVRTVRLDADLARRGVRRVDFLKIDVEGFDYFALRSFDWSLKPKFAVYEFEEHKTLPLGYTLADSSAFMTAQGYHLLYSVWEPIVEYGRDHSWRGLFLDPPTDVATAWGNVLCFARTEDRDRVLRLFGRA